ncbi:MAG TPA: hypothetical protein VJ553_02045 [Candidatus Paceibacterota bacterium]|nr:hypothetical protein [Candidatus Paceibacterota bacterium]
MTTVVEPVKDKRIPDLATPQTWDLSDDEPMIVFEKRDGLGTITSRHRVKVSEWAAYERAHSF